MHANPECPIFPVANDPKIGEYLVNTNQLYLMPSDITMLMPSPSTAVPLGWHRADIRAAVEKHGQTLRGLARSRGLHEMACSRALAARNTPGERAIADLIGVPLWDLWPDRWRRPAVEGGQPERIDNRRREDAAA